MEKQPSSELLPTLLQELYSELRWYRNLEHLIFAFWFTMLMASIFVDPTKITGPKLLAVLLTIGSIITTYFLVSNQRRMEKLRKTIVSIQDNYTDINEKHLSLLGPRIWAGYNFYNFLDPLFYYLMLWFATLVFWIIRVFSN